MEDTTQPAQLVDTQEAATSCGLSTSFLYHHWKGNPAAFRAGRALRWSTRRQVPSVLNRRWNCIDTYSTLVQPFSVSLIVWS